RGPLREDDTQRHRIFDAPGSGRGIRMPAARGLRAGSGADSGAMAERRARTLVATRAARPGTATGGERTRAHRRSHRRLGYRALDGGVCALEGNPRSRYQHLVVRTVRLAPAEALRPSGDRGAARTVRRTRHNGAGGLSRAPVLESPGLESPALKVEEHGIRQGRPVDSCVLVIFGASGDLARRELLPSLFELYRKQLLPEQFTIIGVAP